MSFKIDIRTNLMDAYHAFDRLKRQEIARATKIAINRTLVTLRKESIEIIRKQVRIKSSVLKNEYISMQKAQGRHISTIEGSLLFKSKGIALVEFLRGPKAIPSQKGIPVKKRKKIRVEITPGKKFVVKRGFLLRTASKGIQVMRYAGGMPKMQTAPSVGMLLLSSRKDIGPRIVTRGREIFVKNFRHELEYRTNKIMSAVKK